MRYLIFLFISVISLGLSAQNNKIKSLEDQRKATLREISNTDKLLRETKENTTSLLNRIKLISSQISSRQRVIQLLEQEVNAITQEQTSIEKEIKVLESDLSERQKNYAKAIDGMLRNRQSDNKLLFVLSGKSLSESYRRLKYLREYAEWRSNQADDIKVHRQKLDEKKELLAKTRAGKIALLKQREQEQDNLQSEESEYQSEVSKAQTKQNELQKALDQKRKQAQALNKQIEKLIAEEVARQEREAKRLAREKAEREKRLAEAKAKREAESKKTEEKVNTKPAEKPKEQEKLETGIAEIDTSVKLSSDFAANKGKLPFPITGSYSITSRFGTHQHEKWKVTTQSNGIDIQSQSGAQARAIFDGEVSRVIAFQGFNNCVIIRHGGYYTFYGNIQTLSIKTGDKVKTGQVIGKIYTDPDTGTSELHFQLWKGTTKLDPELWLKK